MVPPPLNFHLDHYDGPLDLLLDLIRKQEIDIRDIPIATITSQYLDYLDKAREMDIDLGAEFVYMAATLIHIKSKMLLPRDPELDKISPEEDPRQELVDRLLEHERFKGAAEMLHQKRVVEENVWSNPALKEYLAEEEDPGLAVSLYDLVKAFGEILERARNRPIYEVGGDDVSIPDMIRHLGSLLRHTSAGEPLYILPLLERQRSVRSMISMFLAVLELVRRQAVRLVQTEMFGEIALCKHGGFDEVFPGDQAADDRALAESEKDYK
ncbi:MAG: segregation/condensation protein A [Candidatus Solibacter usitatus]|nr:segregation/condensation protein A [Candidatus Solibacter usitatus]